MRLVHTGANAVTGSMLVKYADIYTSGLPTTWAFQHTQEILHNLVFQAFLHTVSKQAILSRLMTVRFYPTALLRLIFLCVKVYEF